MQFQSRSPIQIDDEAPTLIISVIGNMVMGSMSANDGYLVPNVEHKRIIQNGGGREIRSAWMPLGRFSPKKALDSRYFFPASAQKDICQKFKIDSTPYAVRRTPRGKISGLSGASTENSNFRIILTATFILIQAAAREHVNAVIWRKKIPWNVRNGRFRTGLRSRTECY